jgi:hypothetical protein
VSAVLQTRAEITKLARLMGSAPDALAYLAGDRARLQRIATAAKVVPVQISPAGVSRH